MIKRVGARKVLEVEGEIMDKVLVVDSDQKNLDYLVTVSGSTNHFEVTAVATMGEAVAALENETISVVVIDHLDSKNIDGLELLAYVSRRHPSMPCIVMTSYGKPWFKEKTGRREGVYVIEKPFNNGSLVSAVFVALSLRDEDMVARRRTVKSFLPLIEMEQRTCGLTVETRNKGKGFLYFDKGELIDAYYNNTNGEGAAGRIAGWKGVRLQFSKLRRRKRLKTLKMDLMALAGAEWKNEDGKEATMTMEPPPLTTKPLPFMSEKELMACIFGDAVDMAWEFQPARINSSTAISG